MTGWAADLALGVRLGVSGGRSGWVRLALISLGVGLGVAMLLVAASAPAVLDARADRAAARWVDSDQVIEPGTPTLLTTPVRSMHRGEAIEGRLLQPESPDAPLPPGVDRQLAPGEVVLSPALERLLASPDGAALRGRWGDVTVGTIGPEGLTGPGELTFYLGTDRLTDETAVRISSFGGDQEPDGGTSPVMVLLALVGIVVLLLPVGIFVATAVRFGSEARDRRLAALRLVGADARTTRRVAAGETLTGAVLGLGVGALLWLLVSRVAGTLVPGALSFFPADVRPSPALVVLVVVLVPLTTVLVTLSALRQVVVEPLGVVRRSGARRRRLWWRLVFPLAGLALLHPLVTGLDTAVGTQVSITTGLILLLTGVALVLPWLVEATVHRLGNGPVAWDLAVRRLQLDSGTAVRAVSGVAVSVAGLIALQGLVGAIGALTAGSAADTRTYQASVLDIFPDEQTGADVAGTWTGALAAAPGVTRVDALTSIGAEPTGGAPDVVVESGPCTVLAQEAQVDACTDGDVFVVVPDGAVAPPAGSTWALGDGTRWTLPDSARPVAPSQGGVAVLSGGGPPRILLTPGALSGLRPDVVAVTAYAALDPAVPDALDHLRTAAAQVDPRAYASSIAQQGIASALVTMRQVLLVGTVALLVLVGASLLVNVLEQLRERRRLLAALVAVGTRRRTLSGSVLVQVAVPVVLGLALAVVTGSVLALGLQAAVEAPLTFDWVGVGTTSGVAAAVVLLTTAAGLPLLWRLTRPEGLRTE